MTDEPTARAARLLRTEYDSAGRAVRERDDAGRVIWQRRSNDGLECEALYGRARKVVRRLRGAGPGTGKDDATGNGSSQTPR